MSRDAPSSPETAPASIRWTVHPPERRRNAGSVTLPCACCCCCCCCLHSLGSLIGGVVGSVKHLHLPPKEISDPDFPFPFRRDELDEEGAVLPVPILYWLLVSLLLGVGAIWYCFSAKSAKPEDFLSGLAIGVGLLPIPQLGASILTAAVVSLFYADKRRALARISRITIYSFVGTIIGLALMGFVCGLFLLR